jgi:hypothetical protein
VLLRLAYLTVANTFAVLRLLPMSDRDKDSQTVLVAPVKYPDVQSLAKDNLPVGLESPTSQMATLVNFTEQKYNVKINRVYLPNSASRADALLAGRLKASLLQIDDAAKVLGQAAKDFHVILKYSELIPENVGATEYATSGFINAHKSLVQEFVSQYAIAVRHAYSDPAWFKAQGNVLLKQYGYKPEIISEAVDQTNQVLGGLINQYERVG